MWTEAKDEQLVSQLGDYPWLYDAEHEKYKDVVMRRNSWNEISKSLDTKGEYSILNCSAFNKIVACSLGPIVLTFSHSN